MLPDECSDKNSNSSDFIMNDNIMENQGDNIHNKQQQQQQVIQQQELLQQQHQQKLLNRLSTNATEETQLLIPTITTTTPSPPIISENNTTGNNNQNYYFTNIDQNMRSNTTKAITNHMHNNNITTNHSSIPNNNSSTSIVALPDFFTSSRRPSQLLQEILSSNRPSAFMAAITRTPPNYLSPSQRPRWAMGSLHELENTGSQRSIQMQSSNGKTSEQAQIEFKRKNRRIGDDALSSALSAFYAKIVVILGVAMPVTQILTSKIPVYVYQGFYIYLYLVSIMFVCFLYVTHLRTRAVFSLIKSYHEKTNNSSYPIKRRVAHFGSFYLRVGAISFGIGTMVYSGLEFGQFFELQKNSDCNNLLIAITPAARMALSIVQMQFIFLNTTELDMARHKVIARFGLMHMVATNLCEWLYVLVEETKHEIHHFSHSVATASLMTTNPAFTSITSPINILNSSVTTELPHLTGKQMADFTPLSQTIISATDCGRSNIMGTLVQNASPFLFPCTIEYSLICAVILYEMWKKIKSLADIDHSRKEAKKNHHKSAHHFSVDCARAHRGMFAGILMIVLTIICLIMYFVLHREPNYEHVAIAEVTICEILMYTLTTAAVLAAVIKMRDLKYQKKSNDHHAGTVTLDCTLLVFAQTGVYVYGMFSIIGNYFSMDEKVNGGKEGLAAEILSLIQTSAQTLFILNASWRKCRGAQQNKLKPGREIVTFLLVANIALWFINTMIKGHAGFRPFHLSFYGIWAWTVITHVSMPLAIFYRFHSTICLFEIWKSVYKAKSSGVEHH